MTKLLQLLAENRLLSASSTRRLLEIMTQTATFPDRLKAGVSPGWILAHKTGTSGTWRGVTAATNDVGILMAPDQKGDQSGGVLRRFAGGPYGSRGTDGQYCADDHQELSLAFTRRGST
jgi:beta-lactamase class A